MDDGIVCVFSSREASLWDEHGMVENEVQFSGTGAARESIQSIKSFVVKDSSSDRVLSHVE